MCAMSRLHLINSITRIIFAMYVSENNKPLFRFKLQFYVMTGLLNGRPKLESHHWLILRTPGTISCVFKPQRDLHPFFVASKLAISHGKLDHLRPGSCWPEHVFLVRPRCFSDTNHLYLVPEATQSISTALWSRRNRKFHLKQQNNMEKRPVWTFICGFAEMHLTHI